MKRVFIVIMAILAACILGACSKPFDITDLGGKVLSYYSSFGGEYNGHDTGTYSFNEAGDGGTFEMISFDFNYPSAQAEADVAVSGKTWFQTGGYRGTFTYAKDTSLVTMDMTHGYTQKEGVATEYQADFEWRTFLSISQENMTPDLTSAIMTQAITLVINQDNIAPVYFADGDNYTMTMATTQSFSTGTNSMTMVMRMSETLSIGATAFTTTIVEDSTQTLVTGGGEPAVNHTIQTDRYLFNVNNTFEIGGTGTDFAKIWKVGKGVSFNLTQTEYSLIVDDTSDAAPEAPVVDQATGVGVNDPAGPDYYEIDRNQSSFSMSLKRGKNYVIFTPYLASASRSVK